MSDSLKSYLTLGISLVSAIVVSLLAGMLGMYERGIVMYIGINMILAVSLNMVNGFTGQFSLGHAGFMSVGAYASATCTTLLAPSLVGSVSGITQEAYFFAALIVGGIAAAITGLLVGIPSLRLKGDYLAIVTLGFGEIIRVIFINIPKLGGSLGLDGIPRYTTFFWVFILLGFVIFIIQSVVNSTYGRGFLAVRDDEIAAEAMGVNTTKYKVVSFVLSAFFAGIAGGLFAHSEGTISPETFGFQKSVEIIIMVILGGMGNTYGVLFAAALLTYLPELLRKASFNGFDLSKFRMSIYALMLIIIMLTRPQGLFGGERPKWLQSGKKKKQIA